MSDREYWPKFKDQAGYLIAQTSFVWVCGILFTRLSTDIWVGPRPIFVGVTILCLVYLYMHIGYYMTLAMRIPIMLVLIYLIHVHLLNPGDFFLNLRIDLSWKHLLSLWTIMNFSFLFHSELYPFCDGSLHISLAPSSKKADQMCADSAKVVNFPIHAKGIR